MFGNTQNTFFLEELYNRKHVETLECSRQLPEDKSAADLLIFAPSWVSRMREKKQINVWWATKLRQLIF